VTLYLPDDNREAMFQMPRMVLKAGECIVDGGEIRATPAGEALFTTPAYDADRLPAVRQWFEQHYSVQFANYGVG
jgi:formylmethanofuran dehydrogenase subunit A